MALMEMIVDPVLSRWVPEWVLEQYKRWNPYFTLSLNRVLAKDKERKLRNREVLRATKKLMVKWAEKRKVPEPEEQEDGEDLSD